VSHKFWAGVVAPVIVTAAIAFFGSAAPAAAATPKPPVMAHKGLHYPYGPAPENSVGAIEAAAALGVPTEIDILLSKATKVHPYGVPFVFHDQTLRRMTNRAGYVSSFAPDVLAHTCLVTVPRTDKCSEYTIPRLKTVLERTRAAHGTLDIEIKHETLTWNQALVIVKRLEAVDAWTWDTLPGFDYPLILSAWAQPLAQVRAVAAHRGDPPLLTEFLSVHPDYSVENTSGSTMEAVYFRNATAAAVTQLHDLGFKVDVYTTNDPADWDALAAAGVDWVISDNVVNYRKWAAP
jgi:glycerophosphoryl diester phosphodiesterase